MALKTNHPRAVAELPATIVKFYFLIVGLLFVGHSPTVYGSDLSHEFVGSGACAQCHQQETADWRQSDHHKAMQPASAETVLGDFDDVTVKFHDIESRFFREGASFKVATAGKDGKPGVFTVNYTFGHYPLQQYLIDIGDGHLQALNLAWDSRSSEQGGQNWYHLQTDEDIDPEHPFFWTRHFQNSNSRCIVCHSTKVSKNYNPDKNSYATDWSEIGVGCESCHGPASAHLALATNQQLGPENTGFKQQRMPALAWAFKGDDTIASPSGTRDDSFIDTCGGCHSRRSSHGDVEPQAAYHDEYRLALINDGLYFADGQINDEVFVLGSFLQSKMHLKGVTCANCHNTHSGKLLATGNALCAQCHKPERFDNVEHHRHEKNSAGAQCVNCHMPEKTFMMVDDRRDHSFTIPDPAISQRSNAPNACTGCHQGRTDDWAAKSLTDWGKEERQEYWPLINQGLDRQDALMFKEYARYAAEFDLSPIREASLISKIGGFPSQLAVDAAAKKLTSPDPLLRRAAVNALQAMPLQLRWQLLNPLIEDPVKSVRLEVAGALVQTSAQLTGKDAQRFNRLLEEYRETLDYNADSPGGQLSIGNLEAGLGFSILAENAYLRSLEIEPGFVPTLINLADLYRSTGRDQESRKVLLKALQIAPDSANTNHAYALFLIRAGQADEALPYLRASLGQEDTTSRHIYVYAIALDSRGETGKAIQVINQANEDWPNNIDLSFLQVAYMEKTGNTEGIHRYLIFLASVSSQDPQVQAWMKKYGTGQ